MKYKNDLGRKRLMKKWKSYLQIYIWATSIIFIRKSIKNIFDCLWWSLFTVEERQCKKDVIAKRPIWELISSNCISETIKNSDTRLLFVHSTSIGYIPDLRYFFRRDLWSLMAWIRKSIMSWIRLYPICQFFVWKKCLRLSTIGK